MRLDELLRFTGRFFEEERVPYFVFGATALNFWIPPRNTVDLDAVICVDKKRGVGLLQALRRLKLPVTATLGRLFQEGRTVRIPLGDSELDLKRGRTDHELEALRRSKVFAAEDFRLRIAVPEDLILFKLQAWRRLDQADIESLLKGRSDLDVTYLSDWMERLERETGLPLRARWEEIRGA